MFRVLTLCALSFSFAAALAHGATFDRITLSRTACFGTCPVYTVSVTGAGAISYSGVRFVAEQGARAATLDAAGLKRLEAAIDAADIDALRDNYAQGDERCERAATDHPSEDLVIERSGHEKRIHYYLGCSGPRIDGELARLAALGRAIDEIVDTGRWVGEPGAAHE